MLRQDQDQSMNSTYRTSSENTSANSTLLTVDYYDLEALSEHSETAELLDEKDTESLQSQPRKDGPVTWMSLPRKDQLSILFLCRLVDFLQVASVQAYVFYQLRHLDDTKSDAEISGQVGVLQGAFTGAQVLTAILWGKAADANWCGRKTVLVVGLFGTAVSCLGYGFASSFYWAVFWRAFGGAINGLVGIIRTMIAEITVERKYQSRAFLLLPMSFNVAGILGPCEYLPSAQDLGQFTNNIQYLVAFLQIQSELCQHSLTMVESSRRTWCATIHTHCRPLSMPFFLPLLA